MSKNPKRIYHLQRHKWAFIECFSVKAPVPEICTVAKGNFNTLCIDFVQQHLIVKLFILKKRIRIFFFGICNQILSTKNYSVIHSIKNMLEHC